MEILSGNILPMIFAILGVAALKTLFLKLVAALIVAVAVHEAGHYLVALALGKKISFSFTTTKLLFIPIPRFVWEMPSDVTVKQNNVIALAGFGIELLISVIIVLARFFGYSSLLILNYYVIASIIHLVLYPMYAGDYNDFKMLIKESSESEEETTEEEEVETETTVEESSEEVVPEETSEENTEA